MHLHREHPRAFAALAAAAGDVEREVLGGQASLAGRGLGREDFADRGERVGVGGRVRARAACERRLVDGDDPVQELPPGDPRVPARRGRRTIVMLPRGTVEDVEHQRGFAGARDAGDRQEQP